MLQTVIRFSIERPRIASPVYSSTWPIPPDADPADRAEDHVLRGHTGRQLALERTRIVRAALRQALRGEHVLDLRRADAERERAERAVRGGVAVAADDRHSRLRQPELGADHVDDPLAAAAGREERTPNSSQLRRKRFELRLRERIGHRASSVGTLWSIVASDRSGRRTAGRRAAGPRTPGAM